VRVEVKFCGVTSASDARLACLAGAAYVGVVFAGGPRLVDPQRAQAIVAAAGEVSVFGVFGSQTPAQILALRDVVGFRGAQLHGDYPRSAARELSGDGIVVWRVVRVAGLADLDRLPAAAEYADAVLIEPLVAAAGGGTGVALSDDLARAARERLRGHRMVLAGGLTAETVGRRAAFVRPDVVDVSSGVEIRPGIKDPVRITRFMEALI
jgi:phosphoribosylanthranilate isomerase